MTVQVNSNRKGVEVSWDTSGNGGGDPEVRPPEFPEHPMDPPVEGVGDAHPEHPIVLPPFIWGPDDPRPNPPIELPPEIADGITDEEVKQKLIEFLTGNLPPYEGGPSYPAPVHEGTSAVQVFGLGQGGDWSNTAVQPNDGLAFLSYPKDFKGESYIEVRGLDGTLVDSGIITVE